MDKLSVIFQNLRHLFPWFAGHGVWKLCTGEYTQPGSVTASRGHQVEGFQHKDNVLLADTLEYEIMESMKLYDEILMQIQ